MEEKIYLATKKALTLMGAEDVSFVVERPGDMAHGDYAVNAALAASKALGKNPREIADSLVETLTKELGADISKIEVAGPGFVNITLVPKIITEEIARAATEGESWGKGDYKKGNTTVIEYSCPNPFKEMHIGHLMNTIIGESLARLVESTGSKVVRDSYGGDIGPHVAKAIWALQRKGTIEIETAKEVDDAYVEGAKAYEADEATKNEIDTLNVKIYEESDPAIVDLWSRAREACLKEFRNLYRILGTHFDYYFFESETAPIGMEVVADALEKGIFEKSEGAVIYNGEKKGLHTLVFVTSRGTPTYETKDIGLAFLKEEKIVSDESIIVTAAEQSGHFNVFLAALEEIAPLVAKKTSHVPTGLLSLASGKMGSRLGNVKYAKDLLQEVLETAQEKNNDPIIAQQVGVAAIKYAILRVSLGSNIIYDAEQALSLEGDSGPYLQYATVRAQSILAQKEIGKIDSAPEVPYRIERMITRFPEIVARSERERAPHHVTQFLTQLASEWNSFYAAERILGGEHEAYKLRVAQAFVTTMKNGLWLLGIEVPQKM